MAATGQLYRRVQELYGHDHPTLPIGPEPVAGDPDKRAVWHEAFAALNPVDGPDARGLPDGTLPHLRDTYPIETAWAPKWVGDELRQVDLLGGPQDDAEATTQNIGTDTPNEGTADGPQTAA